MNSKNQLNLSLLKFTNYVQYKIICPDVIIILLDVIYFISLMLFHLFITRIQQILRVYRM